LAGLGALGRFAWTDHAPGRLAWADGRVERDEEYRRLLRDCWMVSDVTVDSKGRWSRN
jgi:hypothetical protein